MNENPSLLTVTNLTVRYGGVTAVDSVSLDLASGGFIGLIGPNGAGKTTFIDALTGFCHASGEVSLAGERLDGLPAFRRARKGIARTFQGAELYEDLTVQENVLVGWHKGRLAHSWLEVLRCREISPPPRIFEILEVFGLSEQADRIAHELPVGLRKLVGVARALAARPRLVLLDEPAAGLDSTERKRLGESLRQLPGHGVTVLLVDHDVDLVLDICDHVHVLDMGKLIASGPGIDIRANARVQEAYLGVVSQAEPAYEEAHP